MDKIDNVLTRGVENILPSREGLEALMKKRKITLYQGFDPSSPKLHLGNLVGIRKLAQFQRLGHKVIFLIGDFTGMIGDPTGKLTTRNKLTRREVLENAKSWKQQAACVLDFTGANAAEIKFNSEWNDKLTFKELIEIASKFTVQQMIERDMFQKRIAKGRPIHLHEFLYPVAQGIDSVEMDVDLEIGGNDQLFNMLAGRTLMKAVRRKEKYVLAMKLLEDPSGKKMGKTEGNTINLTDAPQDLFGKIMALPDTLTDVGIELLTDLPSDFAKTAAPLEAKKVLAFEIIKQVHGEKGAQDAKLAFEKTFQRKEPEYKLEIPQKDSLAGTIAPFTSLGSISEAKRQIQQGAIDVNGAAVYDPNYTPSVGEEIKIGKRTFGTVVEPSEKK